MPGTPATFDKDRAHRLIYDLFMNDEKVIRSMAAQDLKRLLGITGPVPADGVDLPDQNKERDRGA